MRKRIASVFLGICVLTCLMQATAFATEYSGWDPSRTYNKGDTITIDGDSYEYDGDVTSSPLNLSSPPTVKTVYKAGDGMVTWDPTVSGDPAAVTAGTLTFDGATMEVTSSTSSPLPAVTLPGTTGGINVVFKGENTIAASNTDFAKVFTCAGITSFNLTEDSHTTLNAGDNTTFFQYGIYFSSPKSTDSLTITGSGRLRVNAEGNGSGGQHYAISAKDYLPCPVDLIGGILELSGSISGNVTLGGVTIPDGKSLSLAAADSVTKGATGAVINGELRLKAGTTLEDINKLGLTGSGIVVIESEKYIYVDGKWVNYVEDDFFDGLDLSAAPTVKTVYKAGSGTVLWTPTTSDEPAVVTAGKLVLNSAQIKIGDPTAIAFFTLPNVPVKIELEGASTLSTSDSGSGTQPNNANFFYSRNSVELSGSGSIDSGTAGKFIHSDGTVTLNGGMRSGKIYAASAVLNDVTIPENGTLDLESVSGSVSATNTVNNGVLVLKREADTNADIKAIEDLSLTGSGFVKAVAGTTNYYSNDAAVLLSIRGTMNFNQSPEVGAWSKDATLEENGYEFSGDSTYGYTLKLGNLIMDSSDSRACITLPDDGPVNVILVDDKTTRLMNSSGSMLACIASEARDSCTIIGNGKLILSGFSQTGCITSNQNLIIAGGDITITNNLNAPSAYGIDVDDANLTISGGKLKVTARKQALRAGSLTLSSTFIKSPEDAEFDALCKTICDSDDNPVASVMFDTRSVKSVAVNPASVSIQKGGSQTFSATVTGDNDPAQTVIWAVESDVSGTAIDANGVLTIAAGETAATLTVKATSTVDNTKSGTATVTVTPADPIKYEIIQGAGSEWTKGGAGDLAFTADVDYSKFTSVSVDGEIISSDKYTSKSGSTIVTLKASYLETLSAGNHALRVNFTDGYAETAFTIQAATSGDATKTATNSNIPKTGDTNNMALWLFALALIAGGAVTALGINRMRRKTD